MTSSPEFRGQDQNSETAPSVLTPAELAVLAEMESLNTGLPVTGTVQTIDVAQEFIAAVDAYQETRRKPKDNEKRTTGWFSKLMGTLSGVDQPGGGYSGTRIK